MLQRDGSRGEASSAAPLIYSSSSVRRSDTPSHPPPATDQHLSAGADGKYQRRVSARCQLPVLAAPGIVLGADNRVLRPSVYVKEAVIPATRPVIPGFLLLPAGDAGLGGQRLFLTVAKSCGDLTEWTGSVCRFN